MTINTTLSGTEREQFDLADGSVGMRRVGSELALYDPVSGQKTIAELLATTASSLGVDIRAYGFLDHTETSISFNPTTYVFTLTMAGAEWSYYREGVKHTIVTSKSVTLPGSPPSAALYYIYIDNIDGTLSVSTSPWSLLSTQVPVALILWNNALTPKYWLANERHLSGLLRLLHDYLHSNFGTQLTAGGEVGDVVVPAGAPSTDDDNTCSVSETTIYDEDLRFVWAALTDGTGASDNYTVFYRSGASWAWKRSPVPFSRVTTPAEGYIEWDNAGVLTEVTPTDYVNWYLLITNFAGDARYVFIPGRAQYANAEAAYTEDPGTWDWTGFPIAEVVVAYQFTFYSNAAYTVKGKCKLTRMPERLAKSLVRTVGDATSIAHNSTSGIQGGALGEYYHLTAAEVAQLALAHARSHAMTGTLDHSAGNWKLFHSNGAGQVVELAIGDTGEILQSAGPTAPPTWVTPASGSLPDHDGMILIAHGSGMVWVDGICTNRGDPVVYYDSADGHWKEVFW